MGQLTIWKCIFHFTITQIHNQHGLVGRTLEEN